MGACRYVPSGLSPRLGQALTALRPLHRRCQRLLCAIRPDVIHANDWPALPIAMWGKQTTGARIVYDSHEFAREEHSESWLWRMLCRPHVCAIEAAGVHDADRVVTVSPGITRLLAETYSLAEPPLVVLNVPEYVPLKRTRWESVWNCFIMDCSRAAAASKP
jgi:hypothetical protein